MSGQAKILLQLHGKLWPGHYNFILGVGEVESHSNFCWYSLHAMHSCQICPMRDWEQVCAMKAYIGNNKFDIGLNSTLAGTFFLKLHFS